MCIVSFNGLALDPARIHRSVYRAVSMWMNDPACLGKLFSPVMHCFCIADVIYWCVYLIRPGSSGRVVGGLEKWSHLSDRHT